MSVKREERFRQGDIIMTIFRGEPDGRRMVSFDKEFRHGVKFGPLFTQEELQSLLGLLLKHPPATSLLPSVTTRRLSALIAGYRSAETEWEIQQAVEKARRQPIEDIQPARPESRITIVSPMPQFRWAHTCKVCGCHVESHLNIFSTKFKLCPNCAFVHAASPGA